MDGILLKNGEKKVPYDAWSNAVLLQGMKGIVVETVYKVRIEILKVKEDRMDLMRE